MWVTIGILVLSLVDLVHQAAGSGIPEIKTILSGKTMHFVLEFLF